MAKWYENIIKILEENNNYNKDALIHENDDITMYHWSDRTCYFITKVVDQKHIFVKRYEVVADQEKAGGMGHQNWLYFKTVKEKNDYLKKYFPDHSYGDLENSEEEWVYRYHGWYEVRRFNLNTWERCLANAAKDVKPGVNPENLARFYFGLGDEDFAKVQSGKEVVKYNKLQPVSFGVKDYFFDWEF